MISADAQDAKQARHTAVHHFPARRACQFMKCPSLIGQREQVACLLPKPLKYCDYILARQPSAAVCKRSRHFPRHRGCAQGLVKPPQDLLAEDLVRGARAASCSNIQASTPRLHSSASAMTSFVGRAFPPRTLNSSYRQVLSSRSESE